MGLNAAGIADIRFKYRFGRFILHIHIMTISERSVYLWSAVAKKYIKYSEPL